MQNGNIVTYQATCLLPPLPDIFEWKALYYLHFKLRYKIFCTAEKKTKNTRHQALELGS